MTYQSEFPDYDPASMPPLPAGDWVDTSWHNNSCPSFENMTLNLALFIDFEDERARERSGWERYSLYEINPDGSFKTDEPFMWTNDWGEVLKVILGYEAMQVAS